MHRSLKALLKRWFAGICCCFRRGRREGRASSGGGTAGADFWSMKGSYFAIERGQLFCLLGPNGAGAYRNLRDAHAGPSQMLCHKLSFSFSRCAAVSDDCRRVDCIHRRVLLLCLEYDGPVHCERLAMMCAGKTTTINCLTGVLPPSGSLRSITVSMINRLTAGLCSSVSKAMLCGASSSIDVCARAEANCQTCLLTDAA